MTTQVGPIHCQLWMGGLEPYMNETFIMDAFRRMGENPTSVKHKKNKFTGEPAGYCFVHFPTDEMALNAMHKLNGKVIPQTTPPIRFRLNHAGSTTRPSTDREYSLWVGDLTPEVDDYTLYKTFASRYPSIRTAKVILDNAGYSKGYGFVRFAHEEDQKSCLTAMNGYKGLGGKALKISNAVPKTHKTYTNTDYSSSTTTTTTTATAPTTTTTYSNGSSQDYNQYYDTSSYWQNYSAWQSYYDSTGTTADTTSAGMYTDQSQMMQQTTQAVPQAVSTVVPEQTVDDDLELIEHNTPLDVEKLNNELCEQDYSLWDAIEGSRWLPLEAMGIEGA